MKHEAYEHTQFSNAYHSFLLSFEPVLFIYINSFYCIKGPIMNDGCAKWEWWEKKAQRITTKHMHAISLSSSEHNAQEKRNGGKWRWIDFECILEFYLVAVKKAICKMHKEHDEVNRETTSTNTHTVAHITRQAIEAPSTAMLYRHCFAPELKARANEPNRTVFNYCGHFNWVNRTDVATLPHTNPMELLVFGHYFSHTFYSLLFGISCRILFFSARESSSQWVHSQREQQ